ncbi:hypothetical protein UPYG_G00039200 [Umbra pygmaea]|uniref:LEM domain-containing protein n=1 Tax=Umbra pygmaea TaxID=75934 RepID=A0ABD0XPM9_UMBPY
MHHRSRTSLASQLCKAITDGEPRTVQILLSQGANPNLVGSEGVAAVHLAVGKENEKSIRCLKLILQHGADPNVRSSDGLTSLHVAALWGCFQNLKLLLKNGANPNSKDLEGNKPGDLAMQQDNQRCAHLLQEYQSHSVEEGQEEDVPQFQYSIYCGQSDMSTSSESEESCVTSHSSSALSDFGDDPLSSTRRTSCFELSAISRSYNVRHANDWDVDTDWAPSVLSSTRMSFAGSRATLPVLPEGEPLTDFSGLHPPQDIGLDLPVAEIRPSNLQSDTVPSCTSRRASRKSVSFKEEVEEHLPVFRTESPGQGPSGQDSSSPKDRGFDFSEYSEFLDSDRMATILHCQGLDVTSPDHVFIFSRDDNKCSEADMDKTVIGYFPFQEEDENREVQDNIGEEVKVFERPSCSSGSTSDASKYSSCESDHYITTLEASLNPRSVFSLDDEGSKLRCTKICNYKDTQNPMKMNNDSDEFKLDDIIMTECLKDSKVSKADIVEDELQAMVDKLILSDKNCLTPVPSEMCCSSTGVNVDGLLKRTAECTPGLTPALEEDADLSLTPSPFVTGRTRSRLSRSSSRTSKTPESLLFSSSLFEQTLPTPTRAHRQNMKSQSSDNVFYDTPGGHSRTQIFPQNQTEATSVDSFSIYESLETQTSTFRAKRGQRSSACASHTDTLNISNGVEVSASQADTFILPKIDRGQGSCVTASQADTLIITPCLADKFSHREREHDNTSKQPSEKPHSDSLPTYLKNNFLKDDEFLTDDLSSSSDAVPKEGVKSFFHIEPGGSIGPSKEESWNTEDADSQPESSSSQSCSQTTSSSSSSSYFSPKRNDSPSTPGTGCTPRYSLSQLSGFHKPQRLANLSYTPGGRPLIPDNEEPVDYLYTDTEQGHELIETHVPPTSNTSLSTSLSTSSSEDTVLYDWRSLKDAGGLGVKGKENQKPIVPEGWPETSGLTDKELRCRLLELGESPGPISSRTRPVYMQRLRRLLLEPDSKIQQQPDKSLGRSQGHSPELCVALRTFVLPDCQASELALCQQFDQPDQNRKWREGIIKSSFNYLLLDPRVTKNLPYRSHSMTPLECFQTFISAIFYIGKGKRSRPYSHMYEALEYHRGDKTSKKLCSKVQHILQVWQAGQGVISLHCFQNVIPVEAYTREACMVDAIGLKMLTNQKRGDYYGVVSTWPVKKKRELGVHLLYRAMQIFLAEGERQLRPPDIRVGQ